MQYKIHSKRDYYFPATLIINYNLSIATLVEKTIISHDMMTVRWTRQSSNNDFPILQVQTRDEKSFFPALFVTDWQASSSSFFDAHWNLKLASRLLNRKTKKLNRENWTTDMNRRDHHTCKISTFVSKPNSQPRNSKNRRAKSETSGHRPPLVSVSLSTFQVVFPETDCQTDCRPETA